VATFAREAGFDGLMFSSTQRNGGGNLVLFDPDDAVPRGEVRERTIEAVSYRRGRRRSARKAVEPAEGSADLRSLATAPEKPIVLDDIVV